MTIVEDWHLIAVIPDDRMDGRDVLLWAGHMLVGSWCDGWCDAVGRPIRGVTHWTDVQAPGGETCSVL
jgi:hypothetical protein